MMEARRRSQALPTVGEIATRLAVPSHRVEYIIDTRGIKPVGWAGNARVYAETDVDYIRSELRRIAEDREVRQ